MCVPEFPHVHYVLCIFATVSSFCANICLDMITTEKYSPIFVSCKSHKASSYWRIVNGAPKIESNRKLAKLSIKLWQETPPHAKHRPTEDKQVTYQGLGTILVNIHVFYYILLKVCQIPGSALCIQFKQREQSWLIIKI